MFKMVRKYNHVIDFVLLLGRQESLQDFQELEI